MNIRELAERVLFGATLADKLVDLSDAHDEDRGASITTPDAPGRPKGLEVGGASTRAKVAFPKLHELDREDKRGQVFHFFANHELLALELMALALLKFPDAPVGFRRGIVQTMADEQRHMQLYVDYMNRWGVELGHIPVNGYFWRCCAAMQSPLDYVTQMSMTLEQANLDYCLHYADAFRTIGDTDGAAALDEVCADEIGHVKHGVTWFDRLRPPGEDQFAAYARMLTPPLTVTRGKGLGFNEDARRKAGFDESFIAEMRVLTRPSGRPPAVWALDPGHDHALLPAVLASGDDIVVVDRRPPLRVLTDLQAAGITLPAIAVIDGARPIPRAAIEQRQLAALRPWSPDASTIGLFDELDTDGSLSAVEAPTPAPLPPNATCVVSTSVTVAGDGGYVDHGSTRSFIDGGRRVAWLLGRVTNGMPGTLARFCHGDGGGKSRLNTLLESTARAAAAELSASGYAGPATVDVAIAGDGELRMAALANTRLGFTIERATAALSKHLGAGTIGLVLEVTGADAPDDDLATLVLSAGPGVTSLTDPTDASSALVLVTGASVSDCAQLIDCHAARCVRRHSAHPR
jgi:uncharacterized ferritin-like protein (DUF455 family)